MTTVSEWPVRVYWEDTDAGGIVYHASYVRFMERGRGEWLRERGIDQAQMRTTERLQFAVVDMQVEWRRAALFDDLLTVKTRLAEARGASFIFEQRIFRGEELVTDARVRAAVLDSQTLKPRRLPPALTQRFT